MCLRASALAHHPRSKCLGQSPPASIAWSTCTPLNPHPPSQVQFKAHHCTGLILESIDLLGILLHHRGAACHHFARGLRDSLPLTAVSGIFRIQRNRGWVSWWMTRCVHQPIIQLDDRYVKAPRKRRSYQTENLLVTVRAYDNTTRFRRTFQLLLEDGFILSVSLSQT